MSLKPPVPGLRRIHYDGVRPGKAAIVVQPDDVLDVSDDVAEQLLAASGQFKDTSTPAAPDPTPDPAPTPEPTAPDPAPDRPRVSKAPAKKAAPRKKSAAKKP